MKDQPDLSFDDFDETVSPRPETCDFDRVVETALSRRGFLGGVLAMGSVTALGAAGLPSGARAAENRFAFEQIAANAKDAITLPPGYSAKVMIRWGDPLWSDGAPFDPATRGTAAIRASPSSASTGLTTPAGCLLALAQGIENRRSGLFLLLYI